MSKYFTKSRERIDHITYMDDIKEFFKYKKN